MHRNRPQYINLTIDVNLVSSYEECENIVKDIKKTLENHGYAEFSKELNYETTQLSFYPKETFQ